MGDISPEDRDDALSKLDTTAAHSARVWNYLLGGKDHFTADRETGDLILGEDATACGVGFKTESQGERVGLSEPTPLARNQET